MNIAVHAYISIIVAFIVIVIVIVIISFITIIIIVIIISIIITFILIIIHDNCVRLGCQPLPESASCVRPSRLWCSERA